MYKCLFTLLALLLLPACAVPRQAIGSCPGLSLGIFADANFTVTGVGDNMPAHAAGVQVDDKLLEVQPAAASEGIELNPAPFINTEAARDLISAVGPGPNDSSEGNCRDTGIPLILRVERGDEIIEIEIAAGLPRRPQPSDTQSNSPLPIPTATPGPQGSLYF